MDEKDQIKQKLDIAEYVGEFVKLKRSGRNFTALCPFHSERTPSFIVSPERQTWHCFGCGKGGDIYSFVMEYDHVDFGEALRMLADRAGVKLTKSAFSTETEKGKDKIYTLNALAAQYYQYLLLQHPLGESALDYVEKTRDIPLPLIERFQIGYAPNSFHALTDFLIKKKGYTGNDLVEAGLASEKNGRVFDFFKHRLIFPLKNMRGEIIAFSGRALDNTTLPKYVNSRETLLYKKGDTLFGLYEALPGIKQETKVIVVEGEFDVLSAVHEGIPHVVALKGTALTEAQIRLLKRYAEKIIFCLDNDPAGTKAQQRSIEMIEKWGLLASVIRLPQGKDPDELLHSNPAEFKTALKNDQNIYDFILETGAEGIKLSSIEGKRLFMEKVLPFLFSIQNEVIKEHYLKKAAQLLDTSIESLVRQGNKIQQKEERNGQKEAEQSKKKSRQEASEEYLLALVLQSPIPQQLCTRIETILSGTTFQTPVFEKLFMHLVHAVTTTIDFSAPDFAQTLPSELLPSFDQCYLAPLPEFAKEEDLKTEVEKVAREVKLLSARKQLSQISARIQEKERNGEEEDLPQLQDEFQRVTELLK